MRPLTERLPKALVPVLGKPFVDWQLQLLAAQGVSRITFVLGYLGDQIRGHVGDGRRFGLHVRYVDEDDALRGTGGALRLAYDEGALDDAFFLLNGDSYLRIDYAAVAAAWEARALPALMTVYRNEGRYDRSNAVFREGRVVLYDKRARSELRAGMAWIDYGLSVLRTDVVRDWVPPGVVADIADTMSALSRGGLLAGFEVEERFYEVGSPEGVHDLEEFLARNAADAHATGEGSRGAPSS